MVACATLVFRPGEGGNAVTGSRKKGLWLPRGLFSGTLLRGVQTDLDTRVRD